MTIVGIESVTFGVEDMALARRFLDDWGLKRLSSRTTRLVYEAVNGDTVIVRPVDAPRLAPAIEPGNTVRALVWGVSAKRDLVRIARALGDVGKVRTGADGTVWSTDPNGLAIGFRMSRRRKTMMKRARVNSPGAVERLGRRSAFYDRARPVQLAHAVFWCQDVDAMEDFYTSRLGFVVSDRYPGSGVFLRCSGYGDHHNLLFQMRPGGRPGIDHVAFGVRDHHEVFGGGLFLSRRGWETEVGPGRHPLASSYFWYFKNPCGGAIEYSADWDRLTPDWVPVSRQRNPKYFAEWALPKGILEATAKGD